MGFTGVGFLKKMGDPQVTMVVSIPKWSSITWMLWGTHPFSGNLRIGMYMYIYIIVYGQQCLGI
jgi:hypothetical protein